MVHMGASVTPSTVVNSWTVMAPMAAPRLSATSAVAVETMPDGFSHRNRALAWPGGHRDRARDDGTVRRRRDDARPEEPGLQRLLVPEPPGRLPDQPGARRAGTR